MSNVDKEWADKHLKPYNNFNTFVREWINEKNIWLYHHFRPQFFYICDEDNKIPLDFIGLMEYFDGDFEFVCRKLGINTNFDRSPINKSKHDDYREIYDKDTIKIVEDVYARDIELLGYSFDNSSLKDQLKRRSN